MSRLHVVAAGRAGWLAAAGRLSGADGTMGPGDLGGGGGLSCKRKRRAHNLDKHQLTVPEEREGERGGKGGGPPTWLAGCMGVDSDLLCRTCRTPGCDPRSDHSTLHEKYPGFYIPK